VLVLRILLPKSVDEQRRTLTAHSGSRSRATGAVHGDLPNAWPISTDQAPDSVRLAGGWGGGAVSAILRRGRSRLGLFWDLAFIAGRAELRLRGGSDDHAALFVSSSSSACSVPTRKARRSVVWRSARMGASKSSIHCRTRVVRLSKSSACSALFHRLSRRSTRRRVSQRRSDQMSRYQMSRKIAF